MPLGGPLPMLRQVILSLTFEPYSEMIGHRAAVSECMGSKWANGALQVYAHVALTPRTILHVDGETTMWITTTSDPYCCQLNQRYTTYGTATQLQRTASISAAMNRRDRIATQQTRFLSNSPGKPTPSMFSAFTCCPCRQCRTLCRSGWIVCVGSKAAVSIMVPPHYAHVALTYRTTPSHFSIWMARSPCRSQRHVQ